MANKHTSLVALFDAIADKLRKKTGTTAEIVADNFPDVLDTIITPADGSISTKTAKDLSANGATVTVPAGYYPTSTSKDVSRVDQATPTISIDAKGLITASVTQDAGYVSTGTKSDTEQLSTQAAKTITPTKSSQIAVSSGLYTTGDVTVDAIPNAYQDVTGVTAGAGDVLTGKSIVLADGTKVDGAMTNNGTVTPGGLNAGESYTIPAGYHNGKGKVTANSLSSQTTATAEAGDILKGETAWVNGVKITGTIATKSSSDLTASGAEVSVPAGYYASKATKNVKTVTQATPSVSVDGATGVITASVTQESGYVSGTTTSKTSQLTTKAGDTITPTKSSQTAVAKNRYTLGDVTVAAIPDKYQDVSGVTAGEGDVLSGKVIVDAGGTKVTGTMTNNGAVTPDGLNAGGSYTIPAGYHNGSGKVTANSLASQTDGTAVSSDILSGKTAYVDGVRLTGTISTKSSTDVTVSGAYFTVPKGYYDSTVSRHVETTTQATLYISVDETGLITATANQSEGYVDKGTTSSTRQLNTMDAKIITPGTSNKTAVTPRTYTTGYITVKGDANLKAENILEGVSIFGVAGALKKGAGQLPEQVDNVAVARGNLSAILTWTKPILDQNNSYVGVKIVRKVGSCPTSDTDGTVVYEGSATEYTDSGLTNGTVYYYRFFSYNSAGALQNSMRYVNITATNGYTWNKYYSYTVSPTKVSSVHGYLDYREPSVGYLVLNMSPTVSYNGSQFVTNMVLNDVLGAQGSTYSGYVFYQNDDRTSALYMINSDSSFYEQTTGFGNYEQNVGTVVTNVSLVTGGKGEFIESVKNQDINAYPAAGYQDGYYYELVSS